MSTLNQSAQCATIEGNAIVAETKIQWADVVWNPVTGCSKVSPGCAHCYAEAVALRFWAKTQPPVLVPTVEGETARPREFTDVQCHEDRLDQPLRWRKPRKIFVNSMSDLFHESVPDEFISRVFAVMALAPQHTFQVLTKRADRMLKWFDVGVDNREHEVGSAMRAISPGDAGLPEWPLPKLWLGVSVENQHFADERIPLLLYTPAAVRFVSYEPALGPVDLFIPHGQGVGDHLIDGLHMIIFGGESGSDARPCHLEWARETQRQCREAGVAFFMKQLGRRPVDKGHELKLRDSHGGDMAEWAEDLRVREFPPCAISRIDVPK